MRASARQRCSAKRGPSSRLPESSEPPAEVVAFATERARARAERDFAEADRLRDLISDAGWLVVDTAGGFSLEPKPPYEVLPDVAALPDNSSSPDTRRATVSVIADGWPDDVSTCVDALLANTPSDVIVQVLDVGGVAHLDQPRVEMWHVAGPSISWAKARTALLRADTARIHVWCDMSTVFTGDALTPLLDAIDADESVVAAGWRGVNVDVDDNWRSFVDAGPGDVDALLGYLFAMRRSVALAAGGPDPKARFYRNADMEFSFQLREAAGAGGAGARLVVPTADLPCRQGRHHGYHDTDPAYRDKESARTYHRFLQRYRGRTDLLAPR